MADLQGEVSELKRRLDRAETRLSQLEGKFEFISIQLRDIQIYMHGQFEQIDARFDKVEHTLERMPQLVAETVTEILRR